MAEDKQSSCTELVPVTDAAVSLEWDTKLLEKFNNGKLLPQKQLTCASHDLLVNINDLRKHPLVSAMQDHIYFDDKCNSLRHKKDKIQIFVSKKSNATRTTYSIGLLTLSKPRNCHMWDKADVRKCNSNFGSFLTMKLHNESILINVMEQVMGAYFMDTNVQKEATAVKMEEGCLIPMQKDLVSEHRLMSKFFVLDVIDNGKNIEDNDIIEPFMLKRMTKVEFDNLFMIPATVKFSDTHTFLVGTVFNGIIEKVQIPMNMEDSRQRTFSLWMTPHVFIYVKK
ncbi:DBP [Plodia interpunctella granulovirus]|uniref:DBP n=1 Tax=Plodia interpunctella granulovirus TaxID=262175 RepID=A0A1L5JGN7_9BBAC|nr:DBP [Plodia interpunctella granulovirus]APO13951.1 DBP [Plodia interpunctella granulovirus]